VWQGGAVRLRLTDEDGFIGRAAVRRRRVVSEMAKEHPPSLCFGATSRAAWRRSTFALPDQENKKAPDCSGALNHEPIQLFTATEQEYRDTAQTRQQTDKAWGIMSRAGVRKHETFVIGYDLIRV